MQLGTPFLFVCTLAACGSGATAVQQPPPPPTGPAPTLTSQATPDSDFSIGFASHGLPAVTSDAANVAIAIMDMDGPMSPPNLRLSVRDRADAQVHEIVVMSDEQGQAFMAGNEAPAFDDTQLVEANRYLAETHAQRGWLPLADMTLDEPAEDAELPVSQSARSGGVVLTWDEGHVTVTVDGKIVVDRTTSGWLAPPQPPPDDCDDCPVCSNPSYLGHAWLDASRKLIVASIAYSGTDSCWEPSAQDHVIAWE